MCTIYFVMVQRFNERYMDSAWLMPEAAAERVEQVARSLKRAGFDIAWHVWVSAGVIQDGKIDTEEAP